MSERIATLDVIGGQVNLTQYAAGARKGICVQLDLRVDDGALDYVGLNVAQAHQLVVVLDNWIQKVLHSRPVTFEEREHWDVARAAALLAGRAEGDAGEADGAPDRGGPGGGGRLSCGAVAAVSRGPILRLAPAARLRMRMVGHDQS